MAPNRLCLITALAPVPAFLGGSCLLGCSLNAPATGGCSVVSLQCSMYAAGSEKEKRAGCPLHGGIIAQLFAFCNGGMAGAGVGGLRGGGEEGWVCLGLRRHPARSALRRFQEQGESPCLPGGGCALAPLLGERRQARVETPAQAGPAPIPALALRNWWGRLPEPWRGLRSCS